MCKLSIIVPVYNVEQYLTKCIESLLAQTLKEIEIILVDDGSTDKSSKICDQYALKDERIKVIHKTNGGLSEARNKGIEAAKGEYLGFLDSDDWVETNFYQYLYKLIQNTRADIAQCDFVYAYDESIKIEFNNIVKENVYTGIEALGLLYGSECVRTVVVWNKIYRRELFKNIRYPKGKLYEDEFTTYKLIYQAKKVVDSNVSMVYYRQRKDSIMGKGFREERLQVLEAFKQRGKYFEQHGLNELVKKNERNLNISLKRFYLATQRSKLINKKKILRSLKLEIVTYYIRFMKNPYITNIERITLTMCILNGRIFSWLYNRYRC